MTALENIKRYIYERREWLRFFAIVVGVIVILWVLYLSIQTNYRRIQGRVIDTQVEDWGTVRGRQLHRLKIRMESGKEFSIWFRDGQEPDVVEGEVHSFWYQNVDTGYVLER